MTLEEAPTIFWHNDPFPRYNAPSGVIYLLHFPNDLHGKNHYLGWASEGGLERRLLQHASGRGARFTAAITLKNPVFFLAHLWIDKDRHDEHLLKKRGRYKQHCFCDQKTVERRPLATISVALALRDRALQRENRAKMFLANSSLMTKRKGGGLG